MEITGSQKVNAPRQIVFESLLNPEILKNSIPGCDSAEFVDTPKGRQVKMTVSPNFPGMKGSYTVFLETGEVVAPSRVVLITEPSSSIGTIRAKCTTDLSETGTGTLLNYVATAALEGKIASTPEIVIKGAVKVALDQFFKNFEKQVSSITA